MVKRRTASTLRVGGRRGVQWWRRDGVAPTWPPLLFVFRLCLRLQQMMVDLTNDNDAEKEYYGWRERSRDGCVQSVVSRRTSRQISHRSYFD